MPGSTKPKGPLTKSEAQAAIERIDNVRDQAQCTQAMALWQEGKPDESRKLLEQILARNSRQPLARRLLADLAVERGDAGEAERLLVELVRQHPEDEAVFSGSIEGCGRRRAPVWRSSEPDAGSPGAAASGRGSGG